MTFWLILTVATAYDCPWGLGRAPAAVKELVCRVERRPAPSDPYPTREAALRDLRPGQELWQFVREPRRAWKRRVDVEWIAKEAR